ncbi:hypothetical protein SCMU_05660 [Sinomonas cyclohexanicum]|uniref:LytR/CpsA/Psr regulator C-terminal domain-containing protein n=1 Tax=Sinomonas cyclohexanicum TaxID=322009 RepID=A0ABN6FDW7_SINCY|nr:LytR C-terminal domain-containing protein [Corynebacterium cyclohexanicum]BCT74724.1 hypothetical protein SCMU_05660 [Corynebacterium cyclohexanicum]
MARKPKDLTQYHGHHVVNGIELRTQFEEDPDQRELQSRHWRRIRHAVAIAVLGAMLLAGIGMAWAVLTGRLTIPQPGGKQALAATCPTGTFDYLPAPTVTVNVFNAAGKEGLAGQVADLLRARKFTVKDVGNERTSVDAAALVRGGLGGEAAAFTLQRNVPGSIYVRDGRSDASVDLVLGPTFQSLIDPALIDQTPGPIVCALASTTPTPAAG